MKLDDISIFLLGKIFKASVASSKGINAIKFRAEYHKHLDLLDKLEQDGCIERREDNYYIKLLTLLDIFEQGSEVESLFYKCEHLFIFIRLFYLEHPGQCIDLNTLAEISDLPRRDVNVALSYMVQSSIFGGWTTNFYAIEDATVTPSEKILRYESFREAVETMRSWQLKITSEPDISNVAMDQEEHIESFESLLHPVVIEHSLPLYENGHLRDAVLNSVIAIFDLIREKTGLNDDGDRLIGKALSLDDPYLILSDLNSDSGKNDQKGFIQIYKGSFQGVRNPKAHSLTHDLTPQKAAQYLVFASLLARRIDEAEVVKNNDT